MSITRHMFEQELSELHLKIIRMGIAVESAIGDAITALTDMDIALAKKIIDNDDLIDNMEREIEKMCIDLIAKQQPVAKDLRDVTSALKLITDLERIADHASDISEKVLTLSSLRRVMIQHDLVIMAQISKEMLKGALDAYVARDVEKAKETALRDDRVDSLFIKLKSDMVHMIAVDTKNTEQYVELLLICKYFERIADHSQNISEWVIYLVKGDH
ncbi:MAG: phosphate signaling complex protein PhoU [Saccharofermentanales bacterium]